LLASWNWESVFSGTDDKIKSMPSISYTATLEQETAFRTGGTLEHSAVAVHSNNFDAIRLLAALLVMVSHQLFFLGRTQPLIAGRTLGDIGVFAFFVISGYLVAESWYRDPHLVRFALRRFLRIWPALAVATAIISFIGAFITVLPPNTYFGHAVWHFIAGNLQLRVVYDLPGVFASSPVTAMSAVNGSWWSIPLEMRCYLYLAVLGLIGLRRRWCVVLALAVAVFLYTRTLPGHPKASAAHNISFLCIMFFLSGVCARQFVVELLRFRALWVSIGVLLLIGAVLSGGGDLALSIALAPLVLVTGSLSTPWVRAASRFGDLSYGIYIYAYFVQQLSVRYWPGSHSMIASTCASVVVTTGSAWCSWHVVEAPALRLKPHLRRWFPDHAP